jgi:pimeloyl-ACP methyl ester carboxylesterase
MASERSTVVLVHGGFVDGAGWGSVYKILRKDGYDVSVVQNPTTSLADDVATTRQAIKEADGPVVLVGHSYGGAVITEAGNDPKVAKLVYIAAFAPDAGESVASLIKNPVPGAPVPPILPPQNGYLFLDKAKFAAAFAADVDRETATFMADSQVPWAVAALEGAVSAPAWKTKPSWYLVASEDKMIPPPAQRLMAKRAGSTSSKAPAATPSTCRNQTPWRRSSRRLHRLKGEQHAGQNRLCRYGLRWANQDKSGHWVLAIPLGQARSRATK